MLCCRYSFCFFLQLRPIWRFYGDWGLSTDFVGDTRWNCTFWQNGPSSGGGGINRTQNCDSRMKALAQLQSKHARSGGRITVDYYAIIQLRLANNCLFKQCNVSECSIRLIIWATFFLWHSSSFTSFLAHESIWLADESIRTTIVSEAKQLGVACVFTSNWKRVDV